VLRYVSFFCGIGGFDLALDRAGYTNVGACEIAPFPRKVYAYRFGHEPMFGDIDAVTPEAIPAADLWVGGFPCQDCSSAGKRAGINGARSGLLWSLLRLWDASPGVEWLWLENVPGILSGRDGAAAEEPADGSEEEWSVGRPPEDTAWMGVVLGALADRGLRFAWRVLDAQHFGVPQRRARVFFLARRSRDGAHPGEVLLEPESVRRSPEPRRAARKKAAAAPEGRSLFGGGVGVSGGGDGGGDKERHVVNALVARGGADDNEAQSWHLIVAADLAYAAKARDAKGVSQRSADTTLIVTEDLAETLQVAANRKSGVVGGQGLVASIGAAGAEGRGHRVGADEAAGGQLVVVPPLAATLTSGGTPTGSPAGRRHEDMDNLVVVPFDLAQITHPENRSRCDAGSPGPSLAATGQASVAYNVNAAEICARKDHAFETDRARCLDSSGGFATNQGGTVVAEPGPIPIQEVRGRKWKRNSKKDGLGVGRPGDPMFTLQADHQHGVCFAVQPESGQGADLRASEVDVATAITATDGGRSTDRGRRDAQATASGWRVRRLTPLEASRLMGFPDGEGAGWCCLCGAASTADCKCPCGPAYAGYGNAVAVPVIHWIALRLRDALLRAAGGHAVCAVLGRNW